MTEVEDWGEIDGDALVFGGVVSNAHALEALLDWAHERGIGRRAVLGTGDTVAYCGEPARAVALLRAAGIRTIAGNCEEQLAAGARDCGCGFGEGSTCDLASAVWYAHAASALDPDATRWMAGLPRLAVFRAHGRRWGVLHGGAGESNRFLWPGEPAPVLAAEIERFEAIAGPVDGIVAGHSGIAFLARVGRHLWLNAGSLGLPPNDGGYQTRFAVVAADGPRIEQLDYNWLGAATAMRQAGLVQGYERTLETGRWPSEEVLPRRLRRTAAGAR